MLKSTHTARALEELMASFEVGLESFAVCEIQTGWRLICPAIDAVLVHYVLRGAGVLECGDERIPLARNMVVVCPRGTPKNLAGPGPVLREVEAPDACVLMTDGLVSFRACDDTPDLVLVCGAITGPSTGVYNPFSYLPAPVAAGVPGRALAAAFEAMLEELSEPGIGASLLAESLMKQCLLLMLRDQMRRLGPASPLFAGLGDTRLTRAVAEVLKRPAAFHSVDELALVAGMSRSAFAALFQSHYGANPGEFVQAARLRAAARMLRMGLMPVKVIAGAVGYASRSQFSRAFKAAYGVDPSGYRKGADARTTLPELKPRREPSDAAPAAGGPILFDP
ncbi:AraC family transcriptional regulator [Phenylobacterium sp.]|uniref:AraC family transcriptional regulator n=1 Tax=Phenylobacterium sp. TaxID=1871053 RepID=UPI002810A324|nr:AraC family transcriptional regulator [Phenylobacterium sp.]